MYDIYMREKNTHKIVILDDDHYPEGRVSQGVMPEFKSRNINNVVHYKTFDDLKKDIFNRTIDTDSLFVIDSSLIDEPDGHFIDFGRTIPAMLGMLEINYKHIIPASGGSEGRTNNDVFFELLSRQDKIENLGQRCLENIGLSGDPKKVVNAIVDYHDELYPNEINAELKKEIVGEFVEGGNALPR